MNGLDGPLTVEQFASLSTAWPETLLNEGCNLLARIHPRHNRITGDDTVLARALVYVAPRDIRRWGTDADSAPKHIEGHLARLTIRTTNLTASSSEDAEDDYLGL